MVRFFILLSITAFLIREQVLAQNSVYNLAQDSIQQQPLPAPEIKRLIKGGIGLPLFRQSSVSPTWITLAPTVTIEQKIRKGLSVIGRVETDFGFSRYAQLYSLEIPIGLRYYFSLGSRMRKRADRHSFFSHYIGFETHHVIFANLYYDTPNPHVQNYYRGQILDHTTNVGNYSETLNLMQYAYFRIGSQFKIARVNYLDVNVVIPMPNLIYNKTEFTLSTPALINVNYGITW